MTDGIVLKFSTQAAVDEQKRFDDATNRSIATVKQQGDAIRDLEAKLAATQKSLDALAGKQQINAEAAKKVSLAVTQTGQSSNAASGFLQKLLAASGNQGAAKGLGLLASGARALVTSMNPVGIATGLAAAAVLTFATNAIGAETAAEKLSARAREVQANFDLLAASGAKVSEKLASIAGARSATFGTDGIDDAITKLSAFQGKVIGAQNALRDSLATNPKAALDVEQIRALGEAIGLTTTEFRILERAATTSGEEQKAAIRSFEEAAKVTLTAVKETTLGFETGSRAITLSADEAIRALERQAFKTDQQIAKLRNDAVASPKKFEELRDALNTEIELVGKGTKVREVDLKLRELTANGTKKLTDRQQELAVVVQSLARYLDAQAEKERELGEAQREAQADADRFTASWKKNNEERAQASYRFGRALEKVRDDTAILLETDEKAIKLKEREAKLNDILAQADIDPRSQRAGDIERELEFQDKVVQYQEKLAKVRQLGADTFGTIGQNIANAVENGANFRQFLQGTIKDLERLALQRIVVDQLANLGSSFFGAAFGGSRPSRGYANGGVLPGSGPTLFAASGMVLDRTTTFGRGGYNVTAAEGGGAAPEAIVPLGRDKYGRLGVVSADGGGGGNITVVLPNVKSAADARAVRPTLRQTLESVNRANARWRNGARGGR